MVVKIQKPAANIGAALGYNEAKAEGVEMVYSLAEEEEYQGSNLKGHILVTRNVPEGTSIIDEFERLRMLNERSSRGRKLKNPTFHMSVNPGAGDGIFEEKDIVAFVDELMESLGYGSNPYRVFRHDDTGRTHYHVVATRIGQDGLKVHDAFENRRCEQACRSLAPKYDYIYGLDEEDYREQLKKRNSGEKKIREKSPGDEDPSARQTQQKKKKAFVPPFDARSGEPASQQYRTFHKDVMSWAFTTPEQYASIMLLRYNTRIEFYGEEQDTLLFKGLSEDGSAESAPLTEHELGITALSDMLSRCKSTSMSQRKAQRKRVEQLAQWAASQSKTWTAFTRLMKRKGVYVVVSYSKDGKPFGVTWLDRATKCAWKGSETDTDMGWLMRSAAENKWKVAPPKPRAEKQQKTAAAPQKPTMRVRKGKNLSSFTDVPSLENVLKNRHATATHTHGSNADASKNNEDIRRSDEERNEIVI